MTKQTEALKILKQYNAWRRDNNDINQYEMPNPTKIGTAIDVAIEALAQPAQEPVAWMNDIAFSMDKELLGTRSRIVPLYTTPPSREWVGLSDDEITSLEYDHVSYETFDEGEYGTEINIYTKEFARAIEAKLKEKNNGT